MEDETVTGFDDVTTDSQEQTETTTEETAEDSTETHPDQSNTETTTLDDEDLAWAKKKGVDLDDKRAVAKMLRNSDRKVSETSQKAKTSLQEAVDKTNIADIGDDVVAELRNNYRVLETKFAATSYYLDNPDDKQYDAEASAILQETLVEDADFARALGRNLPKLFALAKARHSDETVAKAKDEGRKEERSSLARKQRASATSSAATTQDTPEVDLMMKGFLGTK